MKKILIPIALLLLCCCSNEDDQYTSSDTQYDYYLDSINSPEIDPNAKMEDAYWDTINNHWIHYDETAYFINENRDTIFLIDYYKQKKN